MALLRAAAEGFAAVRRAKRLLALAALTTGLVSLPLALWAGRLVHASASHRPDARAVAAAYDADFFADLRAANPSFDADATALVVAALVLYFVVRPLVTGGYLGIAAAGRRIPFSQFVREGGHLYWKVLRVSLVGVLALFLLTLAMKPLQTWIGGVSARRASEADAIAYRTAFEVFAFAGAAVLAAILDYAKLGLRMHRRPGVLRELGLSALFVLQHPLRTLGFFALAFGLEAAAIALAVPMIRIADGAYVATSLVVLLLGQVLVTLREACRLFHLAGAWHIRRLEEAGRRRAEPIDASGEPDLLEAPLPWNVG